MENKRIITNHMIVRAQNGDIQAQDKIIHSCNSVIEYEVKKYVKDPNNIDLYSELYQIGRYAVIKAIKKFDVNKHDANIKYFKSWIYGDIKRGYDQYNNVEIVRDIDIKATDDLKIEINEIRELLGSDLLTETENTVYINYTGFNHNVMKTQKEIALELGISQLKVHRLYKNAYEKILLRLELPIDKYIQQRVRRKIKNISKRYSSEEKLAKLEDIFLHLNEMLPSHMPYFKIVKKIDDGSYRINVWQGIPVEMDKKKNIAHVDTETPFREFSVLTNFIQSFMDPHQKYSEPVFAFKVPSRTVLIDFIRFYAPYTTRDKMKVLLEMLNINPSTIRVYLDEEHLVRFGRKKSDLFLTIFDSYIERSGKNYIEFKNIDNILRVISLDELLQMNSKGLIKPPYKVDGEKNIFKKNM